MKSRWILQRAALWAILGFFAGNGFAVAEAGTASGEGETPSAEERVLADWGEFTKDESLIERVDSLLVLFDQLGLNDPDSAVRLDRPFPSDARAAALDGLLRLVGDGIRTVVDPIEGSQLARDMDAMLPGLLREERSYPFRLSVTWGRSTETENGRRQGQTIHLTNMGKAPVRSVLVVTIASKLEGSIDDLAHGGGTGGEVYHTLRILPGDLGRLAAGDLDVGEVAELSGEFNAEDYLDGAATHFYYMVLFTDEEGRRRTALPIPLFVGPNEKQGDCAADRDGPLIHTDQATCSWDDCESVFEGMAFLEVEEGNAREDLNGDGDMRDQLLAMRRIGSGESVFISETFSWRADGDLVAYRRNEATEGVDLNEDGDQQDILLYWFRASTGEGGGPFAINRQGPRLADPWIAFAVEEAGVGSDLNGDGDTEDAIVQVIDTRSGEHINTQAEGHAAFAGRRQVWFLTEEARVGSDLNGDEDLEDTVLRWTRFPGVSSLPEGVHSTGVASYYSTIAWTDGGDLAMVATPKSNPSPGNRSDRVAVYLGDDGLELSIVDAYAAVLDGDRWLWSESRAGTAHLRDFAEGSEKSFELPGFVGGLDGRHVLSFSSRGWEYQLGYYDIESGESREIGWSHLNWFGPAAVIKGDFISWHNDVRTECYPSWTSWMEMHRISNATTYKTDGAAYKYTHGAPGRHVVAFTDSEDGKGAEYDGKPGLWARNWSYYVPPCRDFDDLETHIELAVIHDPEIEAELRQVVSNARKAWEGGQVKPVREATCAMFKRLTIPQEEAIAEISRQLVRGCTLSTALALGVIESEESCGTADNCPGRSNPMQVDLDQDGAGNVCDICPGIFNPDQVDSDGDGRGDLCDLCPQVATVRDTDPDGDGVGEECDNCTRKSNPDQQDSDGDGIGDLCDGCPEDPGNDPDGDGICAAVDNCPSVWNRDQQDSDGDGIGDACDPTP